MNEQSLAFKRVVRGWSTSRIVALYVLIGSGWILLSDRLVIFSAPDPVTAALFSTLKGLSYVAVTATLLHWLINRYTAGLRESEERFRIIFEHANDAIHIDTADDEILDVNPRMCELMGYSRDELLTMRIPDLQAPEVRAAGHVIVTELARHGEALFESLNLHRSGQRIPVEISVARVARPQGDLYVSVIRDITDRKRAEEELRQSQAFNQALIDHSPLGISVRNRTGKLLFANAAWRQIWAISDSDLHDDTTRERDALQFNARDDYLAPYQGDLRRVYEQGGYLHLPELKTTHSRPGAAEWVSQHFYAIVDERGQVDRMVILTEDVSDRRRTEEALRESEASLKFSQQVAHVGHWTWNTAANKVIWSDEMYRVFGLDPETFDGDLDQIILRAIHPDDRAKVIASNTTVLTEQKSAPLEYRVIWPDRSVRTIWAVPGDKTVDSSGKIVKLSGIVQDITDRKRAEEALRESEERYRLLAETSPDSIFLHQAGRFVFVNPAGCQLLGAAQPDELIGRRIAEFIHPDYRAIVTERVQTALDQGQPVPVIEETFLRLDGSPVDVEVAASSLLIDGRPTMQVIARDITARKQREREIAVIAAMAMALRTAATSADMFPVIVHQVYALLNVDGAALIMRDPATGEGVIVYGHGVGADSIGLRIPPGSGIVGHVIATGHLYLTQDAGHDPHVFRPDLANDLHALVCAPLIAHHQIIGVLWAGKRTAITDAEGRLLTAISDIAANALHRAEVLQTLEQRVYDRTRELAEANERLTELDRLKSKFVSDVSHELRTPITSLMLNVELLEHGKPEKREQYLRVIRQQTARQVQLIEDILNLSRLELSTARAQSAPVDVNALIEQAVNVYRSSAEAANLRLNFTPDPDQPTVMGVESHLSQVVTNLIANAINYTPAGSVEVATRLAGHEVVIEVRDTGLGIAAEDMPHLFDRFYRGKLTWQVRGSGLGLAIVKEITEVHRGRVEVDSQAGVGSIFRVYLPVA